MMRCFLFTALAAAAKQPNVIFSECEYPKATVPLPHTLKPPQNAITPPPTLVILDDMDSMLNATAVMPHYVQRLQAEGMTFNNAFVVRFPCARENCPKQRALYTQTHTPDPARPPRSAAPLGRRCSPAAFPTGSTTRRRAGAATLSPRVLGTARGSPM